MTASRDDDIDSALSVTIFSAIVALCLSRSFLTFHCSFVLSSFQGVVLYSFFSGMDAKVAVAFHGSFSAFPPVLVDEIKPYLLM